MSLLTDSERAFAGAVARLVYGNPFLPERIEAERDALGDEFVPHGPAWHAGPEPEPSPNLAKLQDRVEALTERLRDRLSSGARPKPADRALYDDLVTYLLFGRYEERFYEVIQTGKAPTGHNTSYRQFLQDVERFLAVPAVRLEAAHEAPHLFACFFQIRRAFHLIFRNIIGASPAIARLRAAVWQSIFTRDMRRYRRTLYNRMGDVATLIAGPSGTGKELVARAIGLSRYIPFDVARQAFAEDFAESFFALAPAALSPTLIESELFGHRRGAFTGALQDRTGWLEVCPPLGTIFLDEIGEVDVTMQVKLLRVLQTRTFQRLGDTRDRRFHGKIIAATNRELSAEIRAGRFREDFYYRLCSDLILTPSLEDQLRGDPDERGRLVRFLAQRVAGDAEAASLADETERWIDVHLGAAYRWPGNVRELEQCVRNVMIRGEYRPPQPVARAPRERLLARIASGSLTADELLRCYCTLVYAETGSYQETARRLELDRRTVKEKLDRTMLAELAGVDRISRP